MSITPILIASILLTQTPAQGNPSQADPNPPAATPPAGDLLAGPAANESDTTRLTIVRRSFDGTLEDVGPEPDVTAVEQLTLTPEQQAKFDALRADRAAEFDRLVGKNYGIITEFAAALGAQDREKAIELGRKIREGFAPYFTRGMALQEFAKQLDEPQRAEAYRILNEYIQAKIGDYRKLLGEGVEPAQIAVRARLEAFGQLVRQSIERQTSLEREAFEQLSEQLSLTSEQRSRIEAIFGPIFVQKLQGNPVDRKAQLKALAEFNKLLTPEQRIKALKILISRWKPPQAEETTPGVE